MLREIPGVTQDDEKGHENVTRQAVAIAYICGVKHGHLSVFAKKIAVNVHCMSLLLR